MVLLGRLLLAAALLGTVGSTLRAAPHQLAYFNECAGGPHNGWRHMLGSSLDWGQDLLIAAKYSRGHEVVEFIVRSMCDPTEFARFAAPQPDSYRRPHLILMTREMRALATSDRRSGDWRRRGPASELLSPNAYRELCVLSPTLYVASFK